MLYWCLKRVFWAQLEIHTARCIIRIIRIIRVIRTLIRIVRVIRVIRIIRIVIWSQLAINTALCTQIKDLTPLCWCSVSHS